MIRVKKVLMSLVILFCCSFIQIKNENYDVSLSKLIFSNNDVKSKLSLTFDLNNEHTQIFKVIISRRNEFVRISIFQIINKEELQNSPSSYFTFKSNIFLCYDGSEIISNNKVDKNYINNLKSKLKSNVINDSRVFQFDLDSRKKVKFNNPAINPYDLNEQTNPPDLRVHRSALKSTH